MSAGDGELTAATALPDARSLHLWSPVSGTYRERRPGLWCPDYRCGRCGALAMGAYEHAGQVEQKNPRQPCPWRNEDALAVAREILESQPDPATGEQTPPATSQGELFAA